MTNPPREPTPEECTANTTVTIDGSEYTAAWYPQMGGYVGKCWVITDTPLDIVGDGDDEACFTVLVWHDGEFPFGDDDGPPRRLHHCAPSQFVRFGETVAKIQKGAK